VSCLGDVDASFLRFCLQNHDVPVLMPCLIALYWICWLWHHVFRNIECRCKGLH